MEEQNLILDFKINGQDLSCQKPSFDLVENSVGYLKARFHFSEDWNGLYKIAVFQSQRETRAIHANEEDSQSKDGTFFIPFNVIKTPGFRVSCIGTDVKLALDENNRYLDPRINKRITTDPIMISLKGSGPVSAELGVTESDEVNVYDIASLALRVAKEAYTIAWDIEAGLQDVIEILGGKGELNFIEIRYLETGEIELIDLKGYSHLLTFDIVDGKIVKVYVDGIEIDAKYSGTNLVQVGNVKVDISGIFN
jgi:hypothetical protein